MKGKKVLYNGEIYSVLHDYKNGQIEVSKEPGAIYKTVHLVKKEEVSIVTQAAEIQKID